MTSQFLQCKIWQRKIITESDKKISSGFFIAWIFFEIYRKARIINTVTLETDSYVAKIIAPQNDQSIFAMQNLTEKNNYWKW